VRKGWLAWSKRYSPEFRHPLIRRRARRNCSVVKRDDLDFVTPDFSEDESVFEHALRFDFGVLIRPCAKDHDD